MGTLKTGRCLSTLYTLAFCLRARFTAASIEICADYGLGGRIPDIRWTSGFGWRTVRIVSTIKEKNTTKKYFAVSGKSQAQGNSNLCENEKTLGEKIRRMRPKRRNSV